MQLSAVLKFRWHIQYIDPRSTHNHNFLGHPIILTSPCWHSEYEEAFAAAKLEEITTPDCCGAKIIIEARRITDGVRFDQGRIV